MYYIYCTGFAWNILEHHVWSCEWNHFKIKQCQHVPSLPRWTPTFRGITFQQAGPEASAGPKGSASTDSCIKDNSGEELYCSTQSLSAPDGGPLVPPMSRRRHQRWAHGGHKHPAAALWGVTGWPSPPVWHHGAESAPELDTEPNPLEAQCLPQAVQT